MNPPVQCLQDIVHISRSISSICGFPPVMIPPPHTSAPGDDDFSLPVPCPIDELLRSHGIQRSLASKLSQAYQKFALQLKVTSEIRMRQTVEACRQVNIRFGLPAYNPRAAHAAAIEAYLRTLRKMVTEHLLSAYRSRISMSSSVASRFIEIKSSGFVDFSHHKLLVYDDDTRLRSHEINPVYRTCIIHEESEDTADEDRCPRPFPSIYSHPQIVSRPTLARSSEDFFTKPRRESYGRRASSTPNATSPSILASLSRLCLIPPPTRSKREDMTPASLENSLPRSFTMGPKQEVLTVPKSSPSMSIYTTGARSQDLHHGYAKIPVQPITSHTLSPESPSSSSTLAVTRPETLFSSPGTLAPNVLDSRRKIASLPRRRPSHSLAPFPAKMAPNPQSLLPSHQASVDTDFKLMSHPACNSRRRKVAPLPRRLPTAISATCNASHTLHPLSASPPHRTFSSISRTPSLVSLSSSRSGSPASADDDLFTPPSSPSPTRSFDLSETAKFTVDSHTSPLKESLSQVDGLQSCVREVVVKCEDAV